MSSTDVNLSAAEARNYHLRSKHHMQRYAEGPGQLDWDAQPAPFRQFVGAPTLKLPFCAADQDRPFAELTQPHPAPLPVTLANVAALLQLSLGLSAWKSWQGSRWALRNNPSSGNLHPVEGYLLARGVPGLADGVHHYDPLAHALEGRALTAPSAAPCWLAVGLSSVMWREAWKYGERAFRYCQLDIGHAMAAFGYAAASLGWTVAAQPLASGELAALLGLDRESDYPSGRYAYTEDEEPEVLLWLGAPGVTPPPGAAALADWLGAAVWQGQPSVIDPQPGYRWPVIDRVAVATRVHEAPPAGWTPTPGQLSPTPSPHASPASAQTLIQQRRSGQRYQPRHATPAADFYRLLQALLPHEGAPWHVPAMAPAVHLLLCVLRVDGLSPGLYLLPRQPGRVTQWPELALHFPERAPVSALHPDCPRGLGLLRLRTLELPEAQRFMRALCCHQDIASTGAFTVAMLGEFDATLDAHGGHGYRLLLREAGQIGQALYLEAEAAGLRGTGIGCFFDNTLHGALGLNDARLQTLYHFTVGLPVVDARVETTPPYPDADLTERP